MENNNNQSVKNYRNELLSRAQEKYPDRDYSGEGDTLEQTIYEMLEENSALINEQKSKNDEMVSLLVSDPRSASFLQEWVRTGDPRQALVRTFGDDLESLATEEGRSQFGDDLASWRETKAKNDNLATEAEANWQKSLDALDKWGNEHGLSDEQKVKIILRLADIAESALMNEFKVEDFDMVLKETNYDSAIKEARQQGEVYGRNAKIEEKKMTRANEESAMPPSVRGGQGSNVPEQKPQQNTKKDIWDLIRE